MQAVILVGGEGTRLRPLTYSQPKQMLPIVGTPMLERVLDHLARHGVTEAILSLGYLPDRFTAAYPDGRVGDMRVSYAVEPEPLDTAGAIRFAAQHGKVSETFVVVNGDVLTDLDVTALLAFHRDRSAAATIALYPVDDPSRFGVVPTDDEGRVLAFVEKPPRDEAPTNEINAGTYILETSVLDLIAPDERVSVERVTFPQLAAAKSLYARADRNYWLDTGTPTAFLRANTDILEGRRPVTLTPAAVDGSWSHPDARVDDSVTLVSAVIDRHCRVGAGSHVENSVIFPDVTIGQGCSLVGSILGRGCVIGDGVTLGPTCVVGDGEVVPSGTRLEGDVRLGGPA